MTDTVSPCVMHNCPGEAAVCQRHYDALAASRERVQQRLADVHKTLAPLVDDDNRPVEALARHAVARLAEAEALLRENCGDAPMPLGWYERVCAFLAAKENERE